MSLKTDLLAGAVAPASLVHATSHHLMLRGPQVFYAPEDEGGAAAAPPNGEAGADAGGGSDDDPALAAAANEDPDAGAAVEDEDLEDIEHEGKQYKLPPALSQRLRQAADVEARSQAVTRDAERYQVAQAAHKANSAAGEALLSERAKVVSLDEQVGWYEGQNWNQLQAQDADRAQELWMAYQQLKLTRDRAAKEYDDKYKTHVQKVQDDDKTRLKAVEASLADPTTGIKGWGPEMFRDLVTFAETNGVSPAELKNFDVGGWKILHLARLGEKALQKQTATQRQAQSQGTRPAANVGARTPPPPPLSDRASMDSWMKARTAQAERKRA